MLHPGEGDRRAFALLPSLLALLLFSPFVEPQNADHTIVLDDFESAESLARWRGQLELSTDRAAHGRRSLKAMLFPQDVVSDELPRDWRGYDRLRFDIHNPASTPILLGVRIYDELADDVAAEQRSESFLADRKLLLIPGMNHVEVMLQGLEVSSASRKLALARIRRFAISAKGLEGPTPIYLDNLRLTRGIEDAATASSRRPEDGMATLDGRFVTLGQVGPRESIPESDAVRQKRQTAREERRRLQDASDAARTMGLETIYQEIPLVTADLGLDVRPLISSFNDDRTKAEMFDYVAASCRAARVQLEELISGATRLPDVDDTQVGAPLVPPYPRLQGRPIRDGFFRDEAGEPLLALSLHSPSEKLTRFFATPRQHIESYTAGGGSRWTVDDSPVYAAFNAHADAKRVGWDGWCGHLIRDRWSMGGGREEVVICLESPDIKRAIEQYVEREAPRWMRNPELLYNIMGYELQYICYCERSQRMFREWLAKRHATIAGLNSAWKTSFPTFDEIAAPPARDSAPLPGANRAAWFDWATFNQERFADHLAWVKGVIRRFDRATPITAGGSHSMLAGSNPTSGIDEELMADRFNDLMLHEGGGSTMGADLHWALADRRVPLADPEMSASASDLLPHFLHGKSIIQLFYWPAQPSAEYPRMNESSIAHARRWPLSQVAELLRVALDVRRLNKEIAALAAAPREVAILYSRTSLVQIPGALMRGTSTPYLDELRRTYEASLYLDAGTTFITERQLLRGQAHRYKAILVPAARHVPPEVAATLLDYAKGGGHLVITPESLLADQYLRPLDFLAQVGVDVVKSTAGGEGEVGSLEPQYDQALRRTVATAGAVDSDITTRPDAELGSEILQGRGIRQTLKLGQGSAALARFADGSPAVVKTATGAGTVWYLATPLEPQSYARLLDHILERAGVPRPVRVTGASGKRVWQVEARALRRERDWLLYVVNHGGTAVDVNLSLPPGARALKDLRRGAALPPGHPITLDSGETRLIEIEQQLEEARP
ncbi:MAG TPA: beta-galactosidase trimerization domain-containing protein [Vicinamibacteria bacterium]|nr:beta-galactosidase trimerization domain-containing protein [Vicinamibacteria bacterium]